MTTKDSWRLLQVFLAPNCAVFEVEVDTDTYALRCTCPGFKARRACKHTRFTSRRVDPEKRVYELELDQGVEARDLARAQRSSKAFRKFITKYGRIEVL